MIPRARRYIDPNRMRAADLIVARTILAQEGITPGALPIFFEEHLDPAQEESQALKKMISELDAVDLEGWLTRLLLAEYQLLGDELYPGEPGRDCIRDAEGLARFVYALASREKGDESQSLVFKSANFKVAVIFVALRATLEKHGTEPYRKRAKRYLYQDRIDAVYLMAYDSNIEAVEGLANSLEGDGRIASIERYTYPLRRDFKKRKLNRDNAIAVCLRRRRAPGADSAPSENIDDDGTLPEQVFAAEEDGLNPDVVSAEPQDPDSGAV